MTPPRPIPFLLSETELAICRNIGISRNRTQNAHAVYDARVDPKSDSADIHIIGAKGEYVFAKHYGLPPPRVLVHGDGGVFDYMLNGLTVEIKTRGRLGGDFILPAYKKLAADVADLCETPSLESDRVYIVGWLTRDDFAQHQVRVNWGKGETLVVNREFLRQVTAR